MSLKLRAKEFVPSGAGVATTKRSFGLATDDGACCVACVSP